MKCVIGKYVDRQYSPNYTIGELYMIFITDDRKSLDCVWGNDAIPDSISYTIYNDPWFDTITTFELGE